VEPDPAPLALRPTRALGPPTARATLRAVPEDFDVDEILGFEPDGTGEHWLLQVRKRAANTEWVARELARIAGVRAFDVGFAGLKDRHATTTQWFSVPAGRDRVAAWTGVTGEGFEVLQAARHRRKLPRGALKGNRFRITLRDVTGDATDLERRLEQACAQGVPNYFGPQRFGRGLQNLQPAFSGSPARARADGFALSAARSLLFNAVLAHRVGDGSWSRLLSGDLANLDGRNSFFGVDQVDDALSARCARLELHPTGPLWGHGEPRAAATVGQLEQACAATWSGVRDWIEAQRVDAARRALRLRIEEPDVQWSDGRDVARLDFSLRAGSFATTVLRELIDVEEGAER
jgi:tRNA pseudouridine13 synthase